MTEHPADTERVVEPDVIEGWSWGYDEYDETWSIWHRGHPERTAITVWRLANQETLRFAIEGEVPEDIVARVYAVNRRIKKNISQTLATSAL